MRLECGCGKRYRVPDRDCPACGVALRAAAEGPARPLPAGGVDVQVLVQQKHALRDELRVRDRQLRQALLRIRALEADLSRARGERPSTAVRIAEAPVRIVESPWRPLELPSERLDLSILPAGDEAPVLEGALELPSDRVPLFEEPG
jgi:hypothetical protein